LFLDWFAEKVPVFNDWLQTEVSRMDLGTLLVLPPFDVESSMLELDGIHLKPASGLQFVNHLGSGIQARLSVSMDDTMVNQDILMTSDSDEEVQAVTDGEDDRLGAILKIVKSNSKRLVAIRPLKDALTRLDERSLALESQVRLRRERDNFVFARIKEESDFELNRTRENRVVISGLDRASSGVSTHQEKKAHYSKVVSDLVTKACPDLEPKPSVTDVYVSLLRNQASPSIEAVFDSVAGALAFRKAASTLGKAKSPEFASLYFSNSITQATRVRIEIMRAIAKKLTTETENAYVQGFISRPVLRYLSLNPEEPLCAGTGRNYSFVDSVSRFGDLLMDPDLVQAYKRAGSTFQGSMEKYFVVLHELEDRPVASGSNLQQLGPPNSRGARGSRFTPSSRGFSRGRVLGFRGRKRMGGSPKDTPSKKKPSS